MAEGHQSVKKYSPSQPRMNIPTSQNTNTVTVNVPAVTPLAQQGVAEVKVNPQPFAIQMESPTDWPTVIATFLVGIGSILTTLLVGWLSVINQRTQVQSSIAQFRHAWIQELRGVAAKFIALAARIHYEMESDPAYLSSDQSNTTYSELLQMQASMALMLDQSKPYADELDRLMNQVTDALRKRDEKELQNAIQNFVKKSNEVLEMGWSDIKRDLRNERPWRGPQPNSTSN